ncbi:MAG: CCA tRNA nucleotidyltransferase, partial [Endomicrobia bacterium]|nr:CCA tRNA nucleotidyltransferase [Endomicrobiia bacterium]
MKMKFTISDKFAPILDKILRTAVETGYEAYAVGGFVRDLFLKRQSKDLDIMVENINRRGDRLAGVDFAKKISLKFGLREPVVFERFGTAKLFIDGEEVEFVMPRKEYYDDDSRNPDTEIGTLEQDALRRDFTVNALFLRLSDMRVLDFTSKGLKDIEDRIIRVADCANAKIIFRQDPLRILRAVRQSLQLGFSIEAETYKEMKASAQRIKIVSPERVRDEINKILAESNPSKAFKMMDDINLLGEILPEISRLKNLKQPEKYHDDDVYNHTLKVLDRIQAEPVLRMSALLHDAGKYDTYKEIGGKITFYGHENESV